MSWTERYLENPARDELDAALLVAHTLEPAVDERKVRDAFEDLRTRCVAALPDGVTPAGLARFMASEGFKSADNLQSMDASRIDRVLESRRGIPITLSVPYLMVGRGVGMHTEGVNFPGHFLLRADAVLIDPLDAQVLGRDDVDRWLAEANLTHLGANALAGATADEMAVRMFNNVKAIYALRSDYTAALALIDCQLKLVADPGPLHFERAELWYRLGNPTAAIAVLEDARSLLAGTRWESELERRIKRLGSQPGSTVH